jgi:hypothetical protein
MSAPKIKIKIELWPIENLIPYELNVKKHDKTQVAKIAASIAKSNFHQPIVVDRDGVIIAGHGRRLAAIELGLKQVPVWQRNDLFGDTSRAARLADNRVALSDIDPDMLRTELKGLEDDLAGIFDDKELEFLKADLGEMNMGAFVTDMGAVLDDQKSEVDAVMDRATGAGVRVLLSKAFGFKDVSAAGVIAISQFMARAEAATGLKQDAALVAYAEVVR